MPLVEHPWAPADPRVTIRAPQSFDAAEFIAAMNASIGLHHPWVQAPSDEAAFQRYLARLESPTEAGFLVRRLGDDTLCGVINLNLITYEALCSAYLSYYSNEAMAGRGYMKEGMRLVVAHAFGELGLHRLEANIQPGNLRSIEFIRSLGFQREGFSPRYLKINGAWRDHERWALLADGPVEWTA